MNNKIYKITSKGYDNSISIIEDDSEKIKVYEPLYSKSFLYIGDKIKVDIFGESDGYKQAVVAELVEKVSNYDFTPKYYPSYMYMSATEIQKKYETKEKLISEEKKEHYEYLNSYSIFNKELVDAYLYMLSKCNSWVEIEKIYNQRPLIMEIR